MRKIIMQVFFILLASLLVVKPTPAQACVNWGEPVCSTGEIVGNCSGIYITECLDNGGSTWCPPGYYAANNNNGGGGTTTCIPYDTGGGCECGVTNTGACRNCSQAQCTNPSAFGIYCPAGTVRGPTRINRQCFRPSYCAGPGDAQLSTTCCDWTYYDEICEDVPAPNQPGGYRHVCYEAPAPTCNWNYIDTYECVSTCNVTAPTSVSVVQGASATFSRLSRTEAGLQSAETRW